MRRHSFISTIPLLAALALCSCVSVTRPAATRVLGQQKALEKNYTIGQPAEAEVGAVVIRVKDYTVSKVALDEVDVPQDFSIEGPIFSHTFHKGESYPLAGSTIYNGRTYNLMKVDSYGVMFDSDGIVLGKIVSDVDAHGRYEHPVIMLYSFTVTPAGAKLAQKISEKPEAGTPAKNFEITFSGITSDSIRLSYREMAQASSSAQAVAQELTYPRDSKEIHFRDYRIAVIEANADHLRYIVVSD